MRTISMIEGRHLAVGTEITIEGPTEVKHRNNGNLVLAGAKDFVMSEGDTLTLIRRKGFWEEVKRGSSPRPESSGRPLLDKSRHTA
jgi:hypothetical protein